MNLRSLIWGLMALTAGAISYAAAPAGYYDKAEGKSEQALYLSLFEIINNHEPLSYDGVWKAYATTDLDENGKIWDMYSTKRWKYKDDQCGSYSSVGTCYNREHSFPKSWFNDAKPMYTDLFHLYPTDGKVNGQRSNHPFGECANGTTLPSSGSVKALGKLGKSTFAGYSGTVFEPDDEYKGDFARSYFYMAACYSDRNSSWKSDMLAGNKFPFFKTWAINLLLKWHRQDPVSDKEKNRNEAVYNKQKNRNPFIDHPELAEYIWGNKKGQKWNANGEAGLQINQPVDGSTVDFGVTAENVPVIKEVTVKTTGAKDNVTLSVTGPFTLSGKSLTAAQTNAGVKVKIEYCPVAIGDHSGTLSIVCGESRSTATLIGKAVDGMPVGKATNITSESFIAHWTYIGDDNNGKYDFTVTDADGVLDGYPVQVDAKTGYYEVKNLQPETKYTYYVRSNQFTSEGVDVTTAEVLPYVDFLFDGDLFFSTKPGEPSPEAEILVSIENITTDVTVSVNAPFELSLDRSEWAQSVVMNPDESRLYLRLNSAVAGTFESSLTAKTGNYYNDNTVVEGIASDKATFFEDFEAKPAPASTYGTSSYKGSAAEWTLNNAGYWDGSSDKGHDDSAVAIRYGKASNNITCVGMSSSKKGGAGVISFWAKKWNSKENASKIAVETSTDDGATWTSAGTADITDANWKEYTFTANIAGNVRMRFRCTSAARMHFDDVSISDYSSGVSDPSAERHMWDAYSRGGILTVKVDNPEGIDAAVYTVDGITVFDGHLAQGSHTFDSISAGRFVIVYSGDFSRTVLIR